MKIDLAKLEAAIEASPLSARNFYGAFGGKRRVHAWAKKCNPRYMAGVARALRVDIASLLVDPPTREGKTADIKFEEGLLVEAKPKKKSPSQMNKEELIVLAHKLDEDIDLPDKATKKELREIIKGLK
jgi:hypothetical protein